MPNAMLSTPRHTPATVEVRRFSLCGHTPADVRRVAPVLACELVGGDVVVFEGVAGSAYRRFERYAQVRIGPNPRSRTWRALHRDAAGAWYVYESAGFAHTADRARAVAEVDRA